MKKIKIPVVLIVLLGFIWLAGSSQADTSMGSIQLHSRLAYGDQVLQPGTYDVALKMIAEEKVKVGDETLVSRDVVRLILSQGGETKFNGMMAPIPTNKHLRIGSRPVGQVLKYDPKNADQPRLYRIVVEADGNQYASHFEVR